MLRRRPSPILLLPIQFLRAYSNQVPRLVPLVRAATPTIALYVRTACSPLILPFPNYRLSVSVFPILVLPEKKIRTKSCPISSDYRFHSVRSTVCIPPRLSALSCARFQ